MLDEITDTSTYQLYGDRVEVRVENTTRRFAWQLVVNGDESPSTTYYEGILEHKGIFLATAYWEGKFPEFIPFKIVPATKL